MPTQKIVAPPAKAAMFLVLTVNDGAEAEVADVLTEVSDLTKAVSFRVPASDLLCVVGVGHDAWSRLFDAPLPKDLHPFKEFHGDVHSAQATPGDILYRDASFAQWARAKGFDTFCPMGPAVVTGLDPSTLRVRTLLNGDERQNYPISDMRFSVQQLVSLISFDMTLNPGDVILCGTSVGVGSMKPGSTIEVEIAGIGRLSNCFG